MQQLGSDAILVKRRAKLAAFIGGGASNKPARCLVFPESGQPAGGLRCLLSAAGSTGRRNTGVKSLCWGFVFQGLTRPFVELTRDFVQISLRVPRQVGSFRKVLPQQA